MDNTKNKKTNHSVMWAGVFALALIAIVAFLYKTMVYKNLTNVNTALNDVVVSDSHSEKYRAFGCHDCMNIVFDAGSKGSVYSAVTYDKYSKGEFPMYSDHNSKQIGTPLISKDIDRTPKVHEDYNSDYIFNAIKGEQVSDTIIYWVDYIDEQYSEVPEKHKATYNHWAEQAKIFKKRTESNSYWGNLLTMWHDSNVVQDTYFVYNPAEQYSSIF